MALLRVAKRDHWENQVACAFAYLQPMGFSVLSSDTYLLGRSRVMATSFAATSGVSLHGRVNDMPKPAALD